jgi:signal transduction histidine kinase
MLETQQKTGSNNLYDGQFHRYKFLFDNFPVPIHEMSVTNVSDAIANLKAQGIKNIETYIDEYPNFVKELFYDSAIFDVNDAMLALTEANSKAYYRKNFETILGEPCFQFFQAVVISLFYGKNRLSGQSQITTFKGNKIWIEATAMFLSMNGEEVINCTFKEITGQKLKDDAIKLINDRLVTGTFQEHLNNLVAALSEAFDLPYVFIGVPTEDRQKIQTLAFSAQKSIIENVTYNLSKTPCSEIYEIQQKVIYSNHLDKVYTENNTIQIWGGKSYLGYPLLNKSGNVIGHFASVGTGPIQNLDALQDVMELYTSWASTELERLHARQALKEKAETIKTQLDELNQKNQKLEQYIESNMQLENFAYIASHDLKAPIRTVISFSQLLERNLKNKLDEDGKEYLDFIISASRNMRDLIDDLLSYSKINSQPIQKLTFPTEDILVAITTEIQTTIQEKNAIINYNNCSTEINADMIKLKQVFQNLITNAIKFQESNIQPIININCEETSTHWQFYVEDNGIGIKADYYKRIFDLFQKLHHKAEFEGTGLGLAICKKIIAQHGGKIWIESTLGKGTTFYFTIAK